MVGSTLGTSTVTSYIESAAGVGVPGGRLAVVGMGRLGSREMTATSDLDLVVLYDFDDDGPESDGERPLNPVVYYGRLTQRLISTLTVPTRRGTLYAVDMRLRPSGNKGPAATQFKGFLGYQQHEAEVWEHMALTRARPVAGDPLFMAEVEVAIRSVLTTPRDPATVLREALAMRRMIAREKGEEDGWELKVAAGGLLDIEFVAQAMVLIHAREHPSIVETATPGVLEKLAPAGLLPADATETLRAAYALMRDLFQWQRLTVSGRFDPDEARPGLKRRMAAAVGLPDFRVLERHLADTRSAVRAVFEQVMGGRGRAAPAPGPSHPGEGERHRRAPAATDVLPCGGPGHLPAVLSLPLRGGIQGGGIGAAK